jgi:subtilisin family serine protease
MRCRERPRLAHRAVPAAGVSGGRRAGSVLVAALAAGIALVPVAAAAARRREAAVIVQVRSAAAPLAPAAPGQIELRLRQRARRDQAGLLRVLGVAARRGEAGQVRSLWIDDSIALHATPELIVQLRRRPDVRAIEPDRPLRILPASLTLPAPSTSVAATGAPALWAQGQTGKGVTVAVLDTGIAPGFPQLATGPGAWFDPYNQHRTPYDEDDEGHGTDVADVVVSMAPDVKIMAARVFSDGGRSSTSAVHEVFEWALDPDGNPRTDDSPNVVNGSWDDGEPGRCETEFNGDLAALRAAGIVPVFAAGNAGPGAGTGASPASAPGAVAVGSVSSADVVSPFSGRGPSPCGGALYPTLAAYGEGIPINTPTGVSVVSGTSFAAPQVSGAIALLDGMFPGVTPDAVVDALIRGARDVGPPGADPDTGAGVLDVPQAAALLAGSDHEGPRVSVTSGWSRDVAHPGLLISGRAQERGGGTSSGIHAEAFVSLRGVPTGPFSALTASPRDQHDATLAGLIAPHVVRRALDGRHSLYVRARDAAGNWGPVREVVIPFDRDAPTVRARGVRHGNRIALQLLVHDGGSGLLSLRYRVDLGGRDGRWRALTPAAQTALNLRAPRGRRIVLRVRAIDVVGNERRTTFDLPR